MDGTSDITAKSIPGSDDLVEENEQLRVRVRELELALDGASRLSGDAGDLDYGQVTTASLAEVIELMPVSAALFDDERRFVAANQIYRRDIARIPVKLRPGLKFGTILRAVVKSGWKPLDSGKPAQWIARRLDQFENCETVEHRHHNGSSTRSTVRRTADDGRLLLIGDMTELECERAEEAWKDSEERFRAAFENAGVGMALVVPGGKLAAVNKALSAMLGYDEADLLDKNVTDIVHSDFIPNVLRERKEIIAGKPIKRAVERCLVHKDGSRVWTLLDRAMIVSRDGSIDVIVAQYQDVTERKAADVALRESEERLRFFIANSSDHLWLRELNSGRAGFLNPVFERIWGFPQVEGAEQYDHMLARVHPEDREVFKSVRENQSAGPGEISFRIVRPDGELRWLRVKWSVVPERGDGSIWICGVTSDVTEHELAEGALRQSEKRLKDFATVSADRFWETDREHRFTEFFLAEGAFPEKVRNAILGKTRWEWAEQDPGDKHWRRHIRDLEGHRPFRDFRYVNRSGVSGETAHLRVSGQPVFDEHGRFTGYRGTTVDETAEVQARVIAEDAQNRLYAALDFAPHAIALWGPDDRMIYCNAEFFRVYPHLKKAAKRGAAIKDLMEAHKNAGWRVGEDGAPDKLLEHWKNEHSDRSDNEFYATDGRKWVHVRSRKLADGSSIKFHTDISAEKRAEIILRESEELFRSSFEDTKMPMAIISAHKRFIRTNRAFARLIGYSKAELSRTVPRDLVHPDDREIVSVIRESIVSGRRRAVKREYRFLRSDGEIVWCQANSTAIVNQSGSVDHWISHYSDITEAKRAGMALQSDHKILANVAGGTPLPEILSQITRSVEGLNPDFQCAVMLYDRESNTLRIGAAESFSGEFRAKAGRLEVGPEGGSCSVAAYTGKRILIEDLTAPVASTARQSAAIGMGLRACVSQPILSAGSQVLGTLAVYSRRAGKPSRAELDYISSSSAIAGIAIARERTMKEIQTAAENVSGTVGSRYFLSLVEYLQRILDVDYAVVGKIVGEENDRVQTIAVQSGSRLSENFEYMLKGSPCEFVTGQKACFFARGVTKRFPADELLNEMGIEGYAGAPLKNSSGDVIGILVVLSKRPLQRTELTMSLLQIFAARAAGELERMEIELDLRESEARFRDFASSTADRFWESDVEHRMVFVSSALDNDESGVSDHIIGKRIWEHPGIQIEKSALKAHLKTIAAHEPFRDFRFVRIDSAGEQYYLRASGKPLFGDKGNFLGYRGTSVDETDEIESARAAKTAHQRFLNALNNAPEGVTYWDAESRFVMSNGHFKRISPDAISILLPGMTFEEYIRERAVSGTRLTKSPDETADAATAAILEKFKAGYSEYEFSRGDRWFRNRIRRLEDGGTIMYLSDITDIRRREDEFRQALKMEAVGKLTGGVAHDFNNILAAALGNMELVQEDLKGNERASNRIDRAIKAVQRGGELTKRLLAFSRKQTLQPVPTDLCELVHDTIDLLKRTLGENVSIASSFAGNLWTVQVDRNQLENALMNLAINARDAMPNGGTLTFEAANFAFRRGQGRAVESLDSGDYVLLSISDDGAGIAPEILDLVFDPFFTTKDVRQGSGLGLSQVYGFVKQSGGHVEIESEIGRGTTVKLYLPRSHLAEAAAGIDMSETSLPRGAGERVLVVEDDPEVRDVTISILNGLGYRAVDGGDGTGIDGQIGNGAGPIDLVLTDVVLPRGTTGPEIAAHVKAKSADTKVLLMTGYAEGDVLLADGAHLKFPLITKPFEVSDLARKLRDILDDRDPGREVGRERS